MTLRDKIARPTDADRSARLHGDTADAVRDAFSAYAVPIYQFAYRRLGNRDDAEDITSQVFFKAARGLDPSYSEAERRAWLYRAARSAIADVWRSYRGTSIVRLEWSAEMPRPIRQLNPDANRHVEQLLAELNPVQRRVLELRFLEGRTLRETANELGLTQSNVKVIQHRALRRAAELEAAPSDG
jgi:RNA polymerase sigma factor (sigma-70 family)